MPEQWSRNDILDLARSFQGACVLAAAADYDVFSRLAVEPMTAHALASSISTDRRATTALLDALAAMKLLTKQGDRYSVASGIAQLLTATADSTVLPMIQHQANCLRRWTQLSHVLKTGNPADRVPSVRGQQADNQAFINAMHTISGPNADKLVKELPAKEFTHLLDIGGASGTWTMAWLKASPDATATIFDLPDVIPLAEQRIKEAGFADRVKLASGDFYTDELPGGSDLVWLSAIAHQNSRQQNRELFRKIRAALADQGTLLIRDVVMDESHTQPPDGAMFAINMLVGTEAGGTYSFHEYREDLESAGFSRIMQVRDDRWMDAIIHAAKH